MKSKTAIGLVTFLWSIFTILLYMYYRIKIIIFENIYNTNQLNLHVQDSSLAIITWVSGLIFPSWFIHMMGRCIFNSWRQRTIPFNKKHWNDMLTKYRACCLVYFLILFRCISIFIIPFYWGASFFLNLGNLTFSFFDNTIIGYEFSFIEGSYHIC